MLIELDAFSGRPNPRWELDDASSEALWALIAGLAPTGERPAEPTGLGYRGFIVEAASGGSRAGGGYFIRPDVTLADPTRSVERFLLDHLPPEYSELGQRIAAELQAEG